jgi:hypothetical protein
MMPYPSDGNNPQLVSTPNHQKKARSPQPRATRPQALKNFRLKGKLKGFWEYEVDGGARVRYKRGPKDRVVVLVVYACPAPPDTH